jgi:hypothetical protein
MALFRNNGTTVILGLQIVQAREGSLGTGTCANLASVTTSYCSNMRQENPRHRLEISTINANLVCSCCFKVDCVRLCFSC